MWYGRMDSPVCVIDEPRFSWKLTDSHSVSHWASFCCHRCLKAISNDGWHAHLIFIRYQSFASHPAIQIVFELPFSFTVERFGGWAYIWMLDRCDWLGGAQRWEKVEEVILKNRFECQIDDISWFVWQFCLRRKWINNQLDRLRSAIWWRCGVCMPDI